MRRERASLAPDRTIVTTYALVPPATKHMEDYEKVRAEQAAIMDEINMEDIAVNTMPQIGAKAGTTKAGTLNADLEKALWQRASCAMSMMLKPCAMSMVFSVDECTSRWNDGCASVLCLCVTNLQLIYYSTESTIPSLVRHPSGTNSAPFIQRTCHEYVDGSVDIAIALRYTANTSRFQLGAISESPSSQAILRPPTGQSIAHGNHSNNSVRHRNIEIDWNRRLFQVLPLDWACGRLDVWRASLRVMHGLVGRRRNVGSCRLVRTTQQMVRDMGLAKSLVGMYGTALYRTTSPCSSLSRASAVDHVEMQAGALCSRRVCHSRTYKHIG
jgi:hypothetical protein